MSHLYNCSLRLTLIAALLFEGLHLYADEHPTPVTSEHVLVVQNRASADSVAIASYYIQKRNILKSNICTITCPSIEQCSMQEYLDLIKRPIQLFLANSIHPIDFIVLTKGIPIRTNEGPAGGFGTDSMLALMDSPEQKNRVANPYFGKRERFSHAKFHFYLVTRLDGYTRSDCMKLVDRSIESRPRRGVYLIHLGPGHENGGYKPVNDGMRRAQVILQQRGIDSVLDTMNEFPGGQKDLMGYFSWGSNDGRFNRMSYRSMTFAPGSIAETAVSTSGRTFANPDAPGQSLIADLIKQGVTGCKGYVSEPYADSIAHADILFERYTAGYNLAESFYMASASAHWKDVVIGDPLCAPYASKNSAVRK